MVIIVTFRKSRRPAKSFAGIVSGIRAAASNTSTGKSCGKSVSYTHLKQDFTVEPYEDLDLGVQLKYAIQNIKGSYTEAELPDLGDGEAIDTSIPADPNVKNYSYTVVDGEVYYRENSRMVKPELNATAIERVRGMVEMCIRDRI